MNLDKTIAYYRVSTQRQGVSGLGLAAQREDVIRVFGNPEAEYTEIESGKNDDRPQLRVAMEHAKEIGATLVIAKLDRLSRKLSFIALLVESGVPFKCADMPGVDNFTIHILGAVAQRERELTSIRTKSALKILKDRGVKLGNPNAAVSILENRKKRVYAKPDPGKIETLKTLQASGYSYSKLTEVAEQLFGKKLTRMTIYNYLNR
jgi:DNA invertase Pin-like site-specific DNA recombinase